MANAPSRVIAFPGTYAQPGPFEYDNRIFTPEAMDEYNAWLAGAGRGTLQPSLPGLPYEESEQWLDAA